MNTLALLFAVVFLGLPARAATGQGLTVFPSSAVVLSPSDPALLRCYDTLHAFVVRPHADPLSECAADFVRCNAAYWFAAALHGEKVDGQAAMEFIKARVKEVRKLR